MTFEIGLIFIGFVLCNSYFSYKAGMKEGQFLGIVGLTAMLKDHNILKSKNAIHNYDALPLPIQQVLEDPDKVLIESE
jgi:hypothetical protein